MSEPSFTDEFFTIKEEPSINEDISLSTISSGVPIPNRRNLDLSQIRDCGLEFVDSSPLLQDHERYTELNANEMWTSRINGIDVEFTKMEDDDIFQVDKSDLIQDPTLPTLTELNPSRDILEDLNFDDLMLPSEFCVINLPALSRQSPTQQLTATPANSFDSSYSPFLAENISFYKDSLESSSIPSSPLNIITSNTKTYLSLESNSNLNSPILLSPSNSSSTPQKPSSLHELLVKKDPHLLSPGSGSNTLGQSVPGGGLLQTGVTRSTPLRTSPSSSRLSSSAPTHLGLEQIWQRREPRQHLLSTGSLVEADSVSSLSTGGILSPDACDYSLDEACDSEDDSEQEYDYSSDAESGSDGEGGSSSKSNPKKERFFWQYNVQSKGPKGQRLVLKTQLEDPHCLNEITDPVFSPDCSLQGIKHSGKARKGDGNDLTPNPKKLHVIGKELDKLNRIINDMTPVSELPFNVRPHTRKEKNKLASRACRLKKKAQHEANKIKLLGLEHEHKRLISCINVLKQMITSKVVPGTGIDNVEGMKNVDKMVKQATKFKVAGSTTEFVNKVLERVKAGQPSGGLDELGSLGSSYH